MSLFPAKPSFIVIIALMTTACASTEERAGGEPGPYEANREEIYSEPTVVSYEEYKDPLQAINRPIFKFNDVVYRYLLSPVSKGYQKVMPDPVGNSVSNFFSNLREPLFSLNNLFQGKPRESGTSLLRFVVNSTVGLLGLFDPAESWWEIDKEDTDFGDTLAHYGVGYGAYLVLPLLGPSDLRDGTSKIFNWYAHPLNAVDHDRTKKTLIYYENFHDLAPDLSQYPKVVVDREDPYIFFRNFYLQNIMRDAETVQDDRVQEDQKEPENDEDTTQQ